MASSSLRDKLSQRAEQRLHQPGPSAVVPEQGRPGGGS